MHSAFAACLGLISATTLVLAAPANAEGEPDHAKHDHGTIRITAKRIHPNTATLSGDDAIVWMNYSEHVAFVSFDAEVAKHMTCVGPSNFSFENGRVRSGPLRGNEFASVCSLEKGSYPYKVTLLDVGFSTGPPRVLDGKLIIE